MATEFRREDNPSSCSSRKALTVTRRPRGWRVAGGEEVKTGKGKVVTGTEGHLGASLRPSLREERAIREEKELGLLETTRRAASETKTTDLNIRQKHW